MPATPLAPLEIDNVPNDKLTKEPSTPSPASDEDAEAKGSASVKNEPPVRAVFMSWANSFVPIGFFQNGVSLVDFSTEHSLWYFDLKKFIDPSMNDTGSVSLFSQAWTDKFTNDVFYYAKFNNSTFDSILKYDRLLLNLPSEHEKNIYQEEVMGDHEGIAINTSEPFMANPKHTQYTSDQQNLVEPVYRDFYKQLQ